MFYTEYQVICLAEFDGKGHIDCTCIEDTKLSDHPEITTFAKIRNLLALLNSQSHKTGSDAFGLCQGFLIRRRFPHICIKILFPKERILGELGNIFLDKVDDS